MEDAGALVPDALRLSRHPDRTPVMRVEPLPHEPLRLAAAQPPRDDRLRELDLVRARERRQEERDLEAQALALGPARMQERLDLGGEREERLVLLHPGDRPAENVGQVLGLLAAGETRDLRALADARDRLRDLEVRVPLPREVR